MASKVVMPKLGLTMEEGTIGEWMKQEGESVDKGELLFSVETDKITNSVESLNSGILLKIVVEEGDTVDVLSTVGIIGEEGEDYSDLLE